ncbi:glutathione peroxidase [Stenotrophomonas pictorum JCM 9942]|jgi:glutathione peroxidase|uniref:Glutathione peroxidase n=1 Tax=Stenotrophomonas pictorum JCM 9942 TaxID=1236960 RepID=A0A0R0APL9_9GAMM|nr:glutathione peroxidase [Stenotrophomonas pictorum]KRG42804.1 glutathione peroxidase [Stenotrophomonas pictorum JCM 9942]
MPSAFDFQTTTLAGEPLDLSRFRGKVLLVVNVASQCGFTPQYAGLEQLWRQYREHGLVVLGFPCDQFGHQEPGDAAQIQRFCSLDYGVSFPLSAKVKVNGAQAHPLWRWLQREKRGALGIAAIKWNFSKFLIGRDGQVRARYAPTVRPESIEADIRAALAG